MDEKNLNRFMRAQLKETIKYKKKKERIAKKDLGDEPIMEWCQKKSINFRKKWEKK